VVTARGGREAVRSSTEPLSVEEENEESGPVDFLSSLIQILIGQPLRSRRKI
jgi:hypothetical protein